MGHIVGGVTCVDKPVGHGDVHTMQSPAVCVVCTLPSPIILIGDHPLEVTTRKALLAPLMWTTPGSQGLKKCLCRLGV